MRTRRGLAQGLPGRSACRTVQPLLRSLARPAEWNNGPDVLVPPWAVNRGSGVGATNLFQFAIGHTTPTNQVSTLHKGEHTAAIDLKEVPGIGAEIVLTMDGE